MFTLYLHKYLTMSMSNFYRFLLDVIKRNGVVIYTTYLCIDNIDNI